MINEHFFDIIVKDKYNNVKRFATLHPQEEACPENYNLYEDSEIHGLNRLYTTMNDTYESQYDINTSKYYCLNPNFIESPLKFADEGTVKYNGGIICPSSTFPYHQKCIYTGLPKYENDLSFCLGPSVYDQQKKCPNIAQQASELKTLLSKKPQPTLQSNTEYVVKNTEYYCPRNSPIMINNNKFTGRLCTDPETMGIILNRFCDTLEGKGIDCMLRERDYDDDQKKQENSYNYKKLYRLLDDKLGDKLGDMKGSSIDHMKWTHSLKKLHNELQQVPQSIGRLNKELKNNSSVQQKNYFKLHTNGHELKQISNEIQKVQKIQKNQKNTREIEKLQMILNEVQKNTSEIQKNIQSELQNKIQNNTYELQKIHLNGNDLLNEVHSITQLLQEHKHL